MDAQQRKLMETVGRGGGAASSWHEFALDESTIRVRDEKGHQYDVNDKVLSNAFVAASIPFDQRDKYKGAAGSPIPSAVVAKIKKERSTKQIEKPATPRKTPFDWEKDDARAATSQQAAKNKMIAAMEKWAKDAASDFDGDEEEAAGAAPDLADSFLLHSRELVKKSGMSAKNVKAMAADEFHDAFWKLQKSRPKDEGIGGVPRRDRAIASLHSFAKADEVAPWLPPFVLDAGDQEDRKKEAFEPRRNPTKSGPGAERADVIKTARTGIERMQKALSTVREWIKELDLGSKDKTGAAAAALKIACASLKEDVQDSSGRSSHRETDDLMDAICSFVEETDGEELDTDKIRVALTRLVDGLVTLQGMLREAKVTGRVLDAVSAAMGGLKATRAAIADLDT